MYKQYTNKQQYDSDLGYINSKTSEYFQGCSYQVEIKHPLREEYYIDLSVHEGNILNTIKSHDQRVINETWLTTNIINTLPTDFEWSDQTRTFRLVCDTLQIMDHLTEQTDLGVLLDNLLKLFVGQVFRVDTNTFIYLADLNPYHNVDVHQLLVGYPDVFLRIETKS